VGRDRSKTVSIVFSVEIVAAAAAALAMERGQPAFDVSASGVTDSSRIQLRRGIFGLESCVVLRSSRVGIAAFTEAVGVNVDASVNSESSTSTPVGQEP